MFKGYTEAEIKAHVSEEKAYEEAMSGKPLNEESICQSNRYLAKDIAKEKAKIGGNWVVAYAVPFRNVRDIIKQECNAIFIILVRLTNQRYCFIFWPLGGKVIINNGGPSVSTD